VFVKEGTYKYNHPIQNPLLLVTEPRPRDNTYIISATTSLCPVILEKQQHTIKLPSPLLNQSEPDAKSLPTAHVLFQYFHHIVFRGLYCDVGTGFRDRET
jgi:hypothetical protein